METRRLHFCDVILRDDGLLEVIADEGVEVEESMVRELDTVFSSLVARPTGLIVNRLNQYSLTHDALFAVCELRVVKAIAILVYSEISRMSAESHRVYEFDMDVFTAESDAARWLRERLT